MNQGENFWTLFTPGIGKFCTLFSTAKSVRIAFAIDTQNCEIIA